MTQSLNIQHALEDLLADLHFARQHEQLGRLALLAYCDVKRWARQAGKRDVADMALRMFAEQPCLSKADFLQGIDRLVGALQWHEKDFQRSEGRFSAALAGDCGASVQH